MCMTGYFATIARTANGALPDPEVEIPRQQVAEWLGLWHADSALRTVVRSQWNNGLASVPGIAESLRWQRVRGPLAGL